MRIAALVIGAMLANFAVEARADEGLPSEELLAEMGLSDIQVISDNEASTIRGTGYSWSGAYRYRQGIYKLHKWARKFHKHARQFHRRISKKHTFHTVYRPAKRW